MISFKNFYLEAHDKKKIDLYRGTLGHSWGFSKRRIQKLHRSGQFSDSRSKTKTLFIRTWLQGDYKGIMTMLKAHIKDTSNRIYGLISYSVDPRLAQHFKADAVEGAEIRRLKLPAKHIISSEKRLKKILELPNEIKKKYLRDGVGFNINRLFHGISASDDSDGESEITIFKWE